MKLSFIPLGVLCACLGFVSCVCGQAQDVTSGKVSVSVGDVTMTPSGGGAAVPLKAGDIVAVGATVKTGAGARAVIVMTPKAAIRVAENSEVLIEQVDQTVLPVAVVVDLKDGGLSALLKPDGPDQLDFKVRTPSGVAAARGTLYSVAVKDGKGYAQVKEGRVEIVPAAPAAPAAPQ
jgi:hypothetical protein